MALLLAALSAMAGVGRIHGAGHLEPYCTAKAGSSIHVSHPPCWLRRATIYHCARRLLPGF
jgi:hypothetical protein